jgi:hypothetical protein
MIRESPQGNWNGYVILPKNHQYDGENYDNIPVNVHGGLTYSNQELSGWVIGFDTAHVGDFIPSLSSFFGPQQSGHYWTHSEVLSELNNLVAQL